MKGTFSALDLESGIDLHLGSASDLDLGEEDETKERKRRCLKLPGYKSQHRKSAKLPGLHNIKHSFVFLCFCLFAASNKKDHTFGDKSQEHSLFLK